MRSSQVPIKLLVRRLQNKTHIFRFIAANEVSLSIWCKSGSGFQGNFQRSSWCHRLAPGIHPRRHQLLSPIHHTLFLSTYLFLNFYFIDILVHMLYFYYLLFTANLEAYPPPLLISNKCLWSACGPLNLFVWHLRPLNNRTHMCSMWARMCTNIQKKKTMIII